MHDDEGSFALEGSIVRGDPQTCVQVHRSGRRMLITNGNRTVYFWAVDQHQPNVLISYTPTVPFQRIGRYTVSTFMPGWLSPLYHSWDNRARFFRWRICRNGFLNWRHLLLDAHQSRGSSSWDRCRDFVRGIQVHQHPQWKHHSSQDKRSTPERVLNQDGVCRQHAGCRWESWKREFLGQRTETRIVDGRFWRRIRHVSFILGLSNSGMRRQ